MVDNNIIEGRKRRNVLRSLGLLGTGVGSSALLGSVGATQSEQIATQSSGDDRIEEIWDEIVDMIADIVSGPVPLNGDHAQLDEEEREKLLEALESLSPADERPGQSPEHSNSSRASDQATEAGETTDSESEVETQVMNVPTALPFDLCFDMVYLRVCVDSNRPQVGTPRCLTYVPELAYVGFSVNEYSRSFTGGWSLDISAENLWIGVDSDGCLWAGEETSGSCAQLDCPNDTVRYHTDPVSDVATSALGNAMEAAEDVLDDLNDRFSGWQYWVAVAIIALVLVIAAIKYFPVTFFAAGTVVVASKSVSA